MMSLVPEFSGRISRREIALNPQLWFATCATWLLFAISTALLAFVMPDIDRTRMLAFSGTLLGASLLLSRFRPPGLGSVGRHAVVAMSYVAPALGIFAFAPHGSAAVASAMFAGPLTAVWIADHRQIVLHFIAASVILFLPSIFGTVDTATLISCIVLVPAIWTLGGSCAVIVEAAELQGDELEELARRDPLTGAGNRRLLDERLGRLLPAHASAGQSLLLLALDLDGFKNLNDTIGHGAGDELLQAVAAELMHGVRPQDTVIRQGGDEFCVVFPDTGLEQRADMEQAVRRSLARIDHFGERLTAGIGIAAFPADATEPEALLGLADARMLDDKSERAAALAAVPAPSPERYTRPTLVPRPRLRRSPAYRLLRGVSRRRLARNRPVWVAGACMYLMLAVFGSITWEVVPELASPEFPYVVAAGGIIGMALILVPPPRIGSLLNHVVIACSYLVPFAIFVTCAPGGSVGVAATSFAGPFMAIRLIRRRDIAGHLIFASALFFGLIAAGLADAPTTVAIAMLVTALWVLAVSCTFVLEAAEAQGAELQRLIRSDPLTGAGNRRLLSERLGSAVAAHAITCESLAIVSLDLNGFKALNDTLGHAAGDELLQQVAAVLLASARPGDTVVRQGGDEFCLVLPVTSRPEARKIAGRLRTSLSAIDCGGEPLTTGIGIGIFPNDGTTADHLLAAADGRLLADKPARAASADASGAGSETLREAG